MNTLVERCCRWGVLLCAPLSLLYKKGEGRGPGETIILGQAPPPQNITCHSRRKWAEVYYFCVCQISEQHKVAFLPHKHTFTPIAAQQKHLWIFIVGLVLNVNVLMNVVIHKGTNRSKFPKLKISL